MDCLCGSECQLSRKCCLCSDKRKFTTIEKAEKKINEREPESDEEDEDDEDEKKEKLPSSLRHLKDESVFVESSQYVDGKGDVRVLAVFWNNYCVNCKLYFTLKNKLIGNSMTYIAGNHIGSVSIPDNVNISEFIKQTKADLALRFPNEKINIENPLKLPIIPLKRKIHYF